MMQCLLALVAVYILVELIVAVRRLRWRLLASVWSLLDIVVVGLTWLSIILFVVLMVHDANIQSTMSIDRLSYTSFAHSAAYNNVWRSINAMLLTILLVIVCGPTYSIIPPFLFMC